MSHLFIVGVIIVLLGASCAHPTMWSFGKTILHDAPYVVRELATRAGLWNRGAFDAMNIPRSTTEISADEWTRATGLTIMLTGFRAHRWQMHDYAIAIRTSDPHRLIVIPDIVEGGNGPLDVVVAEIMKDIQWHRADVQVTWIGISNGARLAMHCIARHWTPDWPPTHAFLLAGPLRGTTRANLARDWLPTWIRRLFVCDDVLSELVYPAPRVTMVSSLKPTPEQLSWNLYRAHYDYAISPTFSSVDFDDGHVTTDIVYHTGHTGMLPRLQLELCATRDSKREQNAEE